MVSNLAAFTQLNEKINISELVPRKQLSKSINLIGTFSGLESSLVYMLSKILQAKQGSCDHQNSLQVYMVIQQFLSKHKHPYHAFHVSCLSIAVIIPKMHPGKYKNNSPNSRIGRALIPMLQRFVFYENQKTKTGSLINRE